MLRAEKYICSMKSHLQRIFKYEQSSLYGACYLIELGRDNKLYLQESSSCIPFEAHPQIYSCPTPKMWDEFEFKIENLRLVNKENIEERSISVELVFSYEIEFSMLAHVDAQEDLRELQLAINPLTVCQEFPRGIFYKSRIYIKNIRSNKAL